MQAFGDADLDLLVFEDAVDLDFGAERCLNDGHVGTAMQVVAVALEELMRLDATRDDEVAGCSPTQTCLAKTCKAQLLGIANADGYLHRDALAVGHAALPVAFGARIVDGLTGAVALAAGGCRLHITQEGMLHGDHTTLAAAFGAGDLLAAFGHARTVAIGARSQAIVDDLLLGAGSNLFEGQTQADAHIASIGALLTGTASATAAKEAAEDIAEPAAEQVVEVDIAAAAASRAGNGAEPVVLRALVRVAEHVVSFVELFELVLGIGGLVHVRVQLTRLATKRLLDIRLRGITGDAENFVQVLRHVGRIHLSIPQRAILPGSYKSPSAVPAMRTARNTFE